MWQLKTWSAATCMVALAGAAQAALVDRGGGMIYDTTFNITWLADMNYAATSGYATTNAGGTGFSQVLVSGRMGWDAANAWANNLVYGGFDDWRLPTVDPEDMTCSFPPGGGFNCTGGELSHLFVAEFGNLAGESVLNQAGDTAQQIANLALFSNVQTVNYWSGTERTSTVAFAFGPSNGITVIAHKSGAWFALAVRPGDVAAPLPEPQTLALVMLALGAAVVVRRRRPA